MYSRVLRNVLRVSTKLRDEGVLKNNTLIFPTLNVMLKKILPDVSHGCCVKHYSTEDFLLPKHPMERKKTIDERAQKQIDDLIAENPETEKRMKVLELEHNVMKQEGERVPAVLRPRDWVELLKLRNRSQRKKFLNYLFIIEKKNENRKKVQAENTIKLEQVRLERLNAKNNDEMVYGFGNNFLLRRLRDTTMNQLWNWNMLKAIMYGNKIVYDCSYEKYMSALETKSAAKQILESYSYNRQHNFPFEMFLCNMNLSGRLLDCLHRYLPNLFDDDCPITVTPKSYLEIFEKPKLVYLTSNSHQELQKYDPDSIYIIGAYVDKGDSRPISLGKAKEEGLRTAKLPIDRYRRFGDGSGKDLTLNQVCSIMLDAQFGNWEYAVRHVPTRKLFESRVKALERKVQKEMTQNNMNFSEGFNFKENSRFKSKEVNDSRFEEKIRFKSDGANDFSHAARAKLRKQWNE